MCADRLRFAVCVSAGLLAKTKKWCIYNADKWAYTEIWDVQDCNVHVHVPLRFHIGAMDKAIAKLLGQQENYAPPLQEPLEVRRAKAMWTNAMAAS